MKSCWNKLEVSTMANIKGEEMSNYVGIRWNEEMR